MKELILDSDGLREYLTHRFYGKMVCIYDGGDEVLSIEDVVERVREDSLRGEDLVNFLKKAREEFNNDLIGCALDYKK
jgi:hypothetical protein